MWSPEQQRFVDSLPPLLRYGSNKVTARWGRKEDVIHIAAYVCLPVNKHNYLLLDLDYEDAGAAWLDESLPQPTFIIVTPESGHALYGYELATPVIRRLKAGACWVSGRAIEYFEAIRSAYQKSLCADVGYSEWNGKNPLSDRWAPHTHWHNRRYSLDELAKHVHLESTGKRKRKSINLEAATSPNARLFEAGRLWSYRNVKCHSDKAAFQNAILKFLEQYNASIITPEYGNPEPDCNVHGMARSIASYSWKNKDASWMAECRKDRKKLGLGRICPNLTNEERREEKKARQEAGALYANSERKNRSIRAIQTAVEALNERGDRPTVAAIAREAGVTRPTVYAHKHLLGEGGAKV